MDALTLLAAVEDARPALVEGIVREACSAGLAGLWFELVTARGAESLLVAVDEVFPRIARGVPRPPRTRTLTPLAGVARHILPGSRLEALSHRGLERVLCFEFVSPFPAQGDSGGARGRWHLVAELFGSRPNLILVDASTGRILEAARHGPAGGGRSLDPGQAYAPPPDTLRPDPLLCRSVETLQAALTPGLAAVGEAATALRLAFVGLTDRWAHEVAARAGEASPEALARALADLLHRVEAGPWEPHLLLDEDGSPVDLSPIRLRHLPQDRQQPAGSLGDASEHLARRLTAQRGLTERQRALRQVVRRLEDRLRSRRAKLVAESSEFARADEYRRMGEALVAHQPEIPRGATEATLPDPAQGEEATLIIPLDPAVPLAVNAERFFKAARRGRRGAMRVTARLAETVAELERAQAWGRRVAAARHLEEFDSLRREIDGIPRLLAPRDRAVLDAVEPSAAPVGRAGGGRTAGAPAPAGKKRNTGPAPRRFISSEGLPILVGRDNEGNDHLTLHLSRSEDLWLHTEGFPGSHVVIRVQNRTGGIPRRTLIEAAQLAAYYSQARSHGKVAVSYTLRKYVRKPRKSPPGLVTITQVKTIVVSPDKSLISKLAAPED
jgi:predicted ribosome quality control (RQC) complex YloA/Tae2 family protein